MKRGKIVKAHRDISSWLACAITVVVLISIFYRGCEYADKQKERQTQQIERLSQGDNLLKNLERES